MCVRRSFSRRLREGPAVFIAVLQTSAGRLLRAFDAPDFAKRPGLPAWRAPAFGENAIVISRPPRYNGSLQ